MILTVLLTILKIIGIILACLVGFILLLIVLLLFVPIRYSAKGLRTGQEGDPPVEAKACISWLLHLVHVSAVYPAEKIITVRLLGIPILKFPADEKAEDQEKAAKKKAEAEKKAAKKKADEEEKTAKQKALKEKNDKEKSSEIALEDKKESFEDPRTGEENRDEPKLEKDVSNEDLTSDSPVEKTSIFEKIGSFADRIKCTIKGIYDKIKSLVTDKANRAERIRKNIHYYYVILTSDLFERTFEKVKKKLLRLLKEISPKKFEISVLIGMEDPYTVGEIMAIAGMLYPYTYNYLHIQGTFDENIIKGAGKMRGRIYLFSFLKLGIYYLTNRDLKKLIRLFKKEGKSRGRK